MEKDIEVELEGFMKPHLEYEYVDMTFDQVKEFFEGATEACSAKYDTVTVDSACGIKYDPETVRDTEPAFDSARRRHRQKIAKASRKKNRGR